MTGAAIAISLGCCLLFFAWLQRHQLPSAQRINANRKIQPQHPHLERKLLKILGGDRNTANRLILQSRRRYPDKSADWHWEKAIYDLERDRWR